MPGKIGLNGNEAALCLGIAGQFTGSSHSFPVEKVSLGLLAHLTEFEKPTAQGYKMGLRDL